jgi:hypothetical protein
VEVSSLPIAEIGSSDKHIASLADAEARLVRETDGEVQRAVINGVGDKVHHFAMNFGSFSYPWRGWIIFRIRILSLSLLENCVAAVDH